MSNRRSQLSPTAYTMPRMRRPLLLLSVAVLLLATVGPPAGSAQGQALDLREGFWVGESIAWMSLDASVAGAAATLDGVTTTEFVMDVDGDGRANGDWILEGDAVMVFDVAGGLATSILDYDGGGVISGNSEQLEMNGDVTTEAQMTFPGGSIDTNNTDQLHIPITVTTADCYAVDGDWLFPIDELAADRGWTRRDITGWFYAAYTGDVPDETIVEDIAQLYADQQAWTEAARASGSIDISVVPLLVSRAQTLANQLADADECLYPRTGYPDQFETLFTLTLAAGLLSVVASGDLDGLNLHLATMALSMMGDAGGLREATAQVIGNEIQELITASMASDGDTCDPCIVSGDPGQVAQAALAGHYLGQTYEIGGLTYTPERILQAVEVYETAAGQ